MPAPLALANRSLARRVTVIPNVPGGGAAGGGGGWGLTAGSLFNNLWNINAAFDLADRVGSFIKSFMPSFDSGITVTVRGGPNADIRRVWYLCLSILFGRYRNRVVDSFNEISLRGEWDITGKTCRAELFCHGSAVNQALFGSGQSGWTLDAFTSNNLLGTQTGKGVAGGLVIGEPIAAGAGATPGGSAKGFIQRGPEQLTIGGTLPSWLRHGRAVPKQVDKLADWNGPLTCETGTTPRVYTTGRMVRFPDIYREFPLSSNVHGVSLPIFVRFPAATAMALSRDGRPGPYSLPWVTVNSNADIVLPDDGRVITTAEKMNVNVQHPGPPADHRTRSSLLGLVAAALHSPCFQPEAPPCVPTYAGGTGQQAYYPGTAERSIFGDVSGSTIEAVINRVAALRNTSFKARAEGTTDAGDKSADGLPLPLKVPAFAR